MSFTEVFVSLGLLGVFISSLLGHFSIVVKDIIFVPLFLYMTQFQDPIPLGLAGGIGGGLGELSTYLIGRGMGRFTLKEEDKKRIPAWVRKLGLLSVLLVSITPLPDAPVLLFLGSAKFSILKVLALEIIGKVTFYTVVAFVGGFFYPVVSGILPPPWNSVFIIASSIGVLFLVTWRKTREPIFRLALYLISKATAIFRR